MTHNSALTSGNLIFQPTFAGSAMDVDIKSLLSQRTSDIDQPIFEDLKNGRLASKLSERRSQLNSINGGTLLSNLSNRVPKKASAPNFRTKNTSPFDDPVFHTTEEETNTVQAVNVLAMEMATELGIKEIGPYQLIIMHKNDENLSSYQSHTFDGVLHDCTPQQIITPEIFNYVEMLRQQKLYNENRPLYDQETASDVWENYHIHGISDTVTTDHTKFDGNAMNYGKQRVTVSSKGPEFIRNYFGSNIAPGGDAWAIIKKQPVKTDYTLMDPNTIKSSRTNTTLQDKISFRPYQMSFVCMPNGGPLPSEATRSIDEHGFTRRDGIAIYLGHFFSIPPDHVYRNLDINIVGPYTNRNNNDKTSEISLPRLIFNTQSGACTI
jgi:hypothetical protein